MVIFKLVEIVFLSPFLVHAETRTSMLTKLQTEDRVAFIDSVPNERFGIAGIPGPINGTIWTDCPAVQRIQPKCDSCPVIDIYAAPSVHLDVRTWGASHAICGTNWEKNLCFRPTLSACKRSSARPIEPKVSILARNQGIPSCSWWRCCRVSDHPVFHILLYLVRSLPF